jgi:hypothetical protein
MGDRVSLLEERKLGSADERASSAKVLLDRLDEEGGYLAASYFIVAVL